MQTVADIGPRLGIAPTCQALGVARATYYRSRRPKAEPVVRTSPRALSPEERQAVLDVLHGPRFVDQAPPEVYAALLDEDKYLCSLATMYRILGQNQEVRERRQQLRHPHYAAPELLATRPNQVWSWDIERHEAQLNRAVMKGHRRRLVAAGRLKLGVACPVGTDGAGGKQPRQRRGRLVPSDSLGPASETRRCTQGTSG